MLDTRAGTLPPRKDAGWAGAATRHTLFFAVMLDPAEEGARAHDFGGSYRRIHGLSGALRPLETLHVSLWLIGKDMAAAPPNELVAAARAAGARVAMNPFRATLNRVESWTRRAGRWPIVLAGDEGVIGLERLHAALARAHDRPPAPRFTPHVSLLWGRDEIAAEPVRPLSWTVRGFCLAHSFIGESRYEILARFPLGG